LLFILIFWKFLGLGYRSSGVFWRSGAVVMVAGCLVRWWCGGDAMMVAGWVWFVWYADVIILVDNGMVNYCGLILILKVQFVWLMKCL
jgi:hypothetical protein